MSRITDNDRKFGPITIGRANWNPWRLVFSTGGGEDGHPKNSLTAYAFGWVARLDIPTKMKPWRRWVDTGHYEWAKSPNSGYWDEHPREFGFSLSDGHLHLYFGPQTHDSGTTKSTCHSLPWTQWRHIRTSLFDGSGKHFMTEWSGKARGGFMDACAARWAAKDACPTVEFEFEDYDGARIKAVTRIEEREWRFGDGWFKWLSLLRKPMIRRVLNLDFSSEVGTGKGSWKGGTIGHSIDMLPNELHEPAFIRYCEQAHKSKHGEFKLKFIGIVGEQPGKGDGKKATAL